MISGLILRLTAHNTAVLQYLNGLWAHSKSTVQEPDIHLCPLWLLPGDLLSRVSQWLMVDSLQGTFKSEEEDDKILGLRTCYIPKWSHKYWNRLTSLFSIIYCVFLPAREKIASRSHLHQPSCLPSPKIWRFPGVNARKHKKGLYIHWLICSGMAANWKTKRSQSRQLEPPDRFHLEASKEHLPTSCMIGKGETSEKSTVFEMHQLNPVVNTLQSKTLIVGRKQQLSGHCHR